MKKTLLIVLMLLFQIILIGCQNSNNDKLIKLGYWYNNENEKNNNQLIIDEFVKIYPEYQVEMVYIPYSGYSQQILNMSVANNLPDVFWIVEDYLPTFAEKGVLQDLTSFIESDLDFNPDLFFDNALEFTQVNGIQYALPRDIGVQVIAYNKDIFDSNDIEYPTIDWTWNDLISIGKKLTIEEDGYISQYGLGWLDYEALIYSNNGRMFSEDGKTSLLNDTKTVEALQMYSDLVNLYHISPTPSESQGLGNVFFGQRAAMTLVGPWDFSKLEKSKINYDIVPFPIGNNGESKMRLTGLPIGMNKKSNNQAMAYELIKFLCMNELAQTMLAQYGIAMPVIKSIATSTIYTESSIVPKSIDNYFIALAKTQVIPHFTKEIEAINALNPFLDKIYMNEDTAENLKDEIQTAVMAVLNQE